MAIENQLGTVETTIISLIFIGFLMRIIYNLFVKTFDQKVEASIKESKKDFEILKLQFNNIQNNFDRIDNDFSAFKKEIRELFNEAHKDKEHLLKNIKNNKIIMENFIDKLITDGIYKDPSYLKDVKRILKSE